MNRPRAKRNRAVLGNGLRWLLRLVFLLTGLMLVNSVYLIAVTMAEALSGRILQDQLYLLMFLGHLALGLLLIVPLLAFGLLHYRRARRHPNRYARRAGMALYLSALLLLVSGLLLTRFPFFEINAPQVRVPAYWLHVLIPLIAIWLFVLHRLAGPRIRWRRGLAWGLASLALTAALAAPQWLNGESARAATRFTPALAQLEGDRPLPARRLMMDDYCAQCHADIARQTRGGMHKLSSFNNPAYRASIDDTRKLLLKRDGNTDQARLCAACHDQAPLFSGEFDQPGFDPDANPSGSAGITCLGCHAISALTSIKGNGAYLLSRPRFYPFTFSDNPLLQSINRQLIRAKPEFHKETLLRPLHHQAEFCSACHKVHIPKSLNHYRWLRGQDHYDSFLLSGVSGHRVDSFYYPAKARKNCAACHMPLTPSDDPAAIHLAEKSQPVVHHHGFHAANTGVPAMLDKKPSNLESRQRFLRRAARIDLFAMRDGATLDSPLHAPLEQRPPILEPGRSYLLEVVVRTTGVGHQLTQGTVDSNELWLQLTARAGQRTIGVSGALADNGAVDPRAYFLNAFLLDRHGNRISRRNAQDIFVALYDHQIPPGAASVIRYRLDIPSDARGPIRIDAKLNYRKFDTRYVQYVEGEKFRKNDLPITVLAEDRIELPLGESDATTPGKQTTVADWERWNDYGIGLLRNVSSGAKKGDLRLAENAFREVEKRKPEHGALNLARIHFSEGELDLAERDLDSAEKAGGYPWTIAWYRARIAWQRGRLDLAEKQLVKLLNSDFPQARQRGFDFSKDIRAINLLGQVWYDQALRLRRSPASDAYQRYLQQAEKTWRKTLEIDPENAAAHFNLAQLYTLRGDSQQAARHRKLHQRYRPDDQAIEKAVAKRRQIDPIANHAADAGAIYRLSPPKAPPAARRQPWNPIRPIAGSASSERVGDG